MQEACEALCEVCLGRTLVRVPHGIEERLPHLRNQSHALSYADDGATRRAARQLVTHACKAEAEQGGTFASSSSSMLWARLRKRVTAVSALSRVSLSFDASSAPNLVGATMVFLEARRPSYI